MPTPHDLLADLWETLLWADPEREDDEPNEAPDHADDERRAAHGA